MTKNLFSLPRFPTGPRTFVVPCPKCGSENKFSFAKVKKHIKSAPAIPIVAECGCSFAPHEITHLLQEKFIRDNPKVGQ